MDTTIRRNHARAMSAAGLVICAAFGIYFLRSASAHFSQQGDLSAQLTSTNSCQEQSTAFETAVKNNQSCTTDGDCMLFERSCPFLTCGVAINKNGNSAVAAAADNVLKCKSDAGGPIACAGCLYQEVRCSAGRCVTTSDTPRCGNGIKEGSEQCDDGNTVSNDGCSNVCRTETPTPVCGNGICDKGESPFACTPSRENPDVCDGHSFCPEDCGQPTVNSCQEQSTAFETAVKNNQSCTTDGDCMLFERSCPFLTCGVAINKSGERAVATAADSVLRCKSEAGGPTACASCLFATVRCNSGQCVTTSDMPRCGNGIKEGSEQCDDGNTVSNDGCSNVCRTETVAPMHCGTRALGETYKSTDGCNTCSCTEYGEVCTKMACRKPDLCAPIKCENGATYPSCTEEGHVINYFVHPCRLQEELQPVCGNNICEEDESVNCPNDCVKPAIDRCHAMHCVYGCENGRCLAAPSTSNCEPIRCTDGSTHPTCTDDGHVINYFAYPCRQEERTNTCGNNICEAGERDEYFGTQSCIPNASGECIPSPVQKVAGGCPSDCAGKIHTPPSIINTPMSNHFRDTSNDDNVGRAANVLKEKEIIGGYPDGTFGADRYVNRAEAAKFLMTAILLSDLPDLSSENAFHDVASHAWFAKYVAIANRFGVINGHPDGTFKPADPINTAEFLKMLSIAFNLESGQAFPYVDVPSDAWFAPYAGTAYAYGLFTERGTSLEPSRLLTRGEVAVAIAAVLNR